MYEQIKNEISTDYYKKISLTMVSVLLLGI